MIKTITLSILIFFGGIQQIHAQIINYNVVDTACACQHMLMIHANADFMYDNATISIDWGDGTSNLYPFPLGGTGSYGQNATHVYNSAGIFKTITRIYSGYHQQWLDTTVYNYLLADPVACGAIHITTKKTGGSVPDYKYENAPVDFKDVDGKITTVIPHFQGQPIYYNYKGLHPYKCPYTVNLNPVWLQEHGLTQTTPPLIINAFEGVTGFAYPHAYQFLTSCAADTGTAPNIRLENPMAYYFNHTDQKGFLHFDLRNLRCSDPVVATVSIDFPIGCLPLTTGLTNAVINGHTLTFDVNNVRSYSDSASRTIPFNFTASIPLTTQLCFDITISTPNETSLDDNSATVCSMVSNTINPINKLVNLNPVIDSQRVETLTYKINFQNNATDHLNVIHLKMIDTLSENLDPGTFKVISSSHGVNTTVDLSTRVVTFTFHQADVVSSIYGAGMDWDELEIIYSVSEKAGLSGGAAINNTVYIYPNYYPPIVTNTTHNMNQAPLLLEEVNAENISMFPNPAQDKLYFSGNITEIYLYDTSGKLVLESTDIYDDEISLNGLQSGIYQVVLKINDSISNKKLIIKK
nr:T9SS type A sorting domain-containing protein [uncultured Fluviicola sp.]